MSTKTRRLVIRNLLKLIGLIRVASTLQKSHLEWGFSHPIPLAKGGNVANMVFRWCHERTATVEETRHEMKMKDLDIGLDKRVL